MSSHGRHVTTAFHSNSAVIVSRHFRFAGAVARGCRPLLLLVVVVVLCACVCCPFASSLRWLFVSPPSASGPCNLTCACTCARYSDRRCNMLRPYMQICCGMWHLPAMRKPGCCRRSAAGGRRSREGGGNTVSELERELRWPCRPVWGAGADRVLAFIRRSVFICV